MNRAWSFRIMTYVDYTNCNFFVLHPKSILTQFFFILDKVPKPKILKHYISNIKSKKLCIPKSIFSFPPPKDLHWELRKPSKNFQNLTQMLSYDGMNNQPFILQTLIFHPPNFHPSEVLCSGCPDNFVDHRMGLCEWMAWMWSVQDHTLHSQHHIDIAWKPKLLKKSRMIVLTPCIHS